EGVARQDGPAEARALHAAERHVVALADGDRAELGERLAEEHARKHGRAREMPVEVGLVRADELPPDGAHAGLDVHDAVDERDPEPARAGGGFGYELRARGYSSGGASPPPPPPPPGRGLAAPRARFGFALWSLITSSVMSIDLSL